MLKGLKVISSFFATSILSSLSECCVLVIFGGASFSSSWFLVKHFQLLPHSIWFYVIFITLSVLMVWISLFWIKILFIPGNRGKISIFSPLPVNFAHISFRNDGLIPIVAGTWLTIWLFIVTVGWLCAVRQDPFPYKRETKWIGYNRTCKANGNFTEWFTNEYMPFVEREKAKDLDARKFLLFQPPLGATFDQFISGMFTAFIFSIISEREFLIEYPQEFQNIFQNPGWEVNVSNVWPSIPFGHTILDLCTSPSFIVPPNHKWQWSDIVMSEVSTLLSNRQFVVVQSDEYLGPLIWANPYYRQRLCHICGVEEAYQNFANLFLNFTPFIEDYALKVKSLMSNKSFTIAVTDTKIIQGNRKRQMLDTSLRCMSSFSSPNATFLFVSRESQNYPYWRPLGPHEIYNFNDLIVDFKLSKFHERAVLYMLTKEAEAVLSFQGSHLGESLAYSANKPFYSVLQRVPFCGEVPIRLPCIDKFDSIIGWKGSNISVFMTAELSNQMKCLF